MGVDLEFVKYPKRKTDRPQKKLKESVQDLNKPGFVKELLEDVLREDPVEIAETARKQ